MAIGQEARAVNSDSGRDLGAPPSGLDWLGARRG